MDLAVMDEVVFEAIRELDGSHAAESATENLTSATCGKNYAWM
jgi:hypothetical protein